MKAEYNSNVAGKETVILTLPWGRPGEAHGAASSLSDNPQFFCLSQSLSLCELYGLTTAVSDVMVKAKGNFLSVIAGRAMAVTESCPPFFHIRVGRFEVYQQYTGKQQILSDIQCIAPLTLRKTLSTLCT